jgi:uncharacterized protein Yka (UPF0111/DUF47 family)
MFRWFQALLPREDRFFELFNSHAETLVNGASALCDVLKGGPAVADAAQRIFAFERQADVIAHNVLMLAQRTFITPFDRSDIKDLIGSLDDTIDQMQKTAKAILLFEVDSLEPEMAEMGERILQAAKLTVEVVKLLGSLRENSVRLNALTDQIIRLEDDSDTLNDVGIRNLFKRHENGNAMTYIVERKSTIILNA